MNEVDAAWVAGLLEGEGTFLTQPNGHSPRIACQMTDLDVLERLLYLCGGTLHEVTKRQKHWKDCWIWRISGDPAAEVMLSIRDFLGSRRRAKVEEVLSDWFTNGRPYKEDSVRRNQAAQDYLDGKGSLRKLSKQYGFSYESIRRRAIAIQTP